MPLSANSPPMSISRGAVQSPAIATKTLSHVSDRITERRDCERLGSELDIEDRIIERNISRYPDVSEATHNMLKQWRSQESGAATGDRLHAALIEIGKKSIADELQGELLSMSGRLVWVVLCGAITVIFCAFTTSLFAIAISCTASNFLNLTKFSNKHVVSAFCKYHLSFWLLFFCAARQPLQPPPEYEGKYIIYFLLRKDTFSLS